MYPPKVQNAEVRALIRALAVGSHLPSGATVRAALADRYGSRGGVARIYRLLSEERHRCTPAKPLPPDGSLEALQAEVVELRGKLGRSELREEAHQDRWAAEVDGLRLKVAALEPLAHQGRILTETYVLLRHQLQATELRASRYEEELAALRGR
jgi:hypothetical protein